jgi:hypothetical protein
MYPDIYGAFCIISGVKTFSNDIKFDVLNISITDYFFLFISYPLEA